MTRQRHNMVGLLLLLQVLGARGMVTLRKITGSSYTYSYSDGTPFPQWANNPKGAAALYIFYNLTDGGPPYRNTFPTITNGQFCVNTEKFGYHGTANMGRFQCPVDGFTAADRYCCGPDKYQYCCQFMEDPTRKSLVIGLPILLVIIIIVVACCIYWCCKQKAKTKAAIKPTGEFSYISSASKTKMTIDPPTGSTRPPPRSSSSSSPTRVQQSSSVISFPDAESGSSTGQSTPSSASPPPFITDSHEPKLLQRPPTGLKYPYCIPLPPLYGPGTAIQPGLEVAPPDYSTFSSDPSPAPFPDDDKVHPERHPTSTTSTTSSPPAYKEDTNKLIVPPRK